MKTHKTGFTMVEFLVVIAILAILGAMLLPAIAKYKPNKAAPQAEQPVPIPPRFNTRHEQGDGRKFIIITDTKSGQEYLLVQDVGYYGYPVIAITPLLTTNR